MSSIELNDTNTLEFLIKYTDLANKHGSFTLQEADILNRCIKVATGNQDTDISLAKARELLINGIAKGQAKGSYSLEDSSLLLRIIKYISAK